MEHIQWTLWINFAVNFGSTSPVPQPPCLDCLEEKCEKVCHTVSLKSPPALHNRLSPDSTKHALNVNDRGGQNNVSQPLKAQI